jgi:hypothetical protein
MYDLNDTDRLLFSKMYELRQKDGAMKIEVLEYLTPNEPRFEAIPTLAVSDAPEEYSGYGNDEDTALKDCLKKIKNVSLRGLFPHMKKDEM